MPLRPLLSAAVITLAAVVMLTPSAQAATPGSVQLTGNQLESALAPASFFGSGYTVKDSYTSGKSLLRSHAILNAATMSCAAAWVMYGEPGFGETAAADSGAISSQVQAATYLQIIDQFPNAHTAAAVFSAQHAKSVSCRSYTLPATKGAPAEHIVQSVSTTSAEGHEAFLVTQASTFSGESGSLDTYIIVSIDGADLFTVEAFGTNSTAPKDPSLPAVAAYMIGKVSALR
jgi:hypothetical protein